jgi:hypothetical protein
MAPRIPAQNRIQEVRFLFVALLGIASAAAQNRFDQLGRDLERDAQELRISDLRAVLFESGKVVWRTGGAITARAPEEPVIAERLERLAQRGRISLDAPAPVPSGATIRQVLANTADGTPGEEVLENRGFIDALHPIAGSARLPNAVKFATEKHATLGWFSQVYSGRHVVWSYGPTLLIVELPDKHLTLVVSAGSKAMTEAARLEDGNIARSNIALALLGKTTRDELIDRALIALYFGDRDAGAALAHQALDQFPELESTPDVTLLYLFAQLRLRETEASATAVIRDHPSLPTAWFYYGQYLENEKRYREAAACFEKITLHQPPWHNWTLETAKKELMYLKTY